MLKNLDWQRVEKKSLHLSHRGLGLAMAVLINFHFTSSPADVLGKHSPNNSRVNTPLFKKKVKNIALHFCNHVEIAQVQKALHIEILRIA